jgi:hypothetical protein
MSISPVTAPLSDLTPGQMEAAASESILLWLSLYGIKTDDGRPLTFYDHPFLVDIYEDFHPRLVVKKSAQVGFTTCEILRSIWAVKNKKLNAIYTMPTASDAAELVSSKVNRIARQNPVIGTYLMDKDAVHQKQIGDNMVYYRGTFAERQAISISADALFIDELDRSDMQVVETYSSRLQHSRFKWEHYFSNPSMTGVGVDKYWLQSDRREWHVTCPACTQIQILTWPDSIKTIQHDDGSSTSAFVCKSCSSEMPDDARRTGQWIPTGPRKAAFHGYHVSLLMAPWKSADDIVLESKKFQPYFYNFILGEPYDDGTSRLSREALFGCLKPSTAAPRPADFVMGIDTGLRSHVTVASRFGIHSQHDWPGYDEIERLLRENPKCTAVFDQGGDLIEPRKLQEKYKGRVFLCYFVPDRKTIGLIRWGEGEEKGRVLVDRNRFIDLTFGEIREKRLNLLGTQADYAMLADHLDNMYAVKEEDRRMGVSTRVWKRLGPDHAVLSFLYARIALDRLSQHSGSARTVSASRPNTGGSPYQLPGQVMIHGNTMVLPERAKSDDWRL